ncbi:hypothetical protein ACJ73_01958 [Blastomyces percursus]|uniref:C2H2-type domain-containing protein n=1 Tax=Blastomyces percursus TaxID=1658174 RepID=A0A1J9R2L9_9EURO|nr:hypothetical protein ACJ73_01958 [Blastomyces percursus]
MADIGFTHEISDVPHIRLSDDELLRDPYSLSTNATSLPFVTTPASCPYVSYEFRDDTIAAGTTYTEAPFPYLVKSGDNSSPIAATDEIAHVRFYQLHTLSPQESDGESSGFPGPRWRYGSPSGSCGGETEADSSLSEQSWSHVYASRKSQCTGSHSPFSSPLSDTFQYRGPSNCFLSTNVEGSYCRSEHSVSLREVQHYPDPDPEAERKFETDSGSDGRSFTFHANLLTRNPFPGIIKSSLADQDGQEVGELAREVDIQTVSPMTQIQSNQLPGTELGALPGKRTTYSIQSQRAIPSSPRKLNNNRRSTRNCVVLKPAPKQVRKLKSGRSIRGPYSSRSQQKPSDRQFICVFAQYGCQSTFSAKNEWKRHVSSQHLQLGFYRCDVGCCNVSNPEASSSDNRTSSSQNLRSPNDFNRKDLFTQHQRRMHSPWASSNRVSPSKQEQDAFNKSLEKVRKRCWIERRKAPRRSICNFCGWEFSGTYCWDDRMEHVGKHYEKRDVETCEDIALREWAVQEGVLKPASKNKWVLASPKESAERRTEDFRNAMV